MADQPIYFDLFDLLLIARCSSKRPQLDFFCFFFVSAIRQMTPTFGPAPRLQVCARKRTVVARPLSGLGSPSATAANAHRSAAASPD
jgi:hypothetical protein